MGFISISISPTVWIDQTKVDIAREVREVSVPESHRLEHEQVAILVAAELGQNLHVVFHAFAPAVDELNVYAGCLILLIRQARPNAVVSIEPPTF